MLHGCAHNPTGVDASQEDWKRIAEVLKVLTVCVCVCVGLSVLVCVCESGKCFQPWKFSMNLTTIVDAPAIFFFFFFFGGGGLAVIEMIITASKQGLGLYRECLHWKILYMSAVARISSSLNRYTSICASSVLGFAYLCIAVYKRTFFVSYTNTHMSWFVCPHLKAISCVYAWVSVYVFVCVCMCVCVCKNVHGSSSKQAHF